MTRRDALKLTNGDEVIEKGSGASISVLYIEESPKEKLVMIAGISTVDGHGAWTHKEVE